MLAIFLKSLAWCGLAILVTGVVVLVILFVAVLLLEPDSDDVQDPYKQDWWE